MAVAETKADRAQRWLEAHPGATARQCAEAVGATAPYIHRVAKERGLALADHGSPKRAAVAEWIERHPHGTSRACARACGASETYARNVARELGHRFARPHPEAKDTVKARIATWTRANPGSWSWQAAEFAGTSTGYLRAVAAELGLPVKDPAVGNPYLDE